MDDRREFPQDDLAQLVGSRLCHDLVNPISAISNGLELLSLSGTAPSPELQLIGDAVNEALARIRFFRIAFGAAKSSDTISAREAGDVLSQIYGSGRLKVIWQAPGDLSRADVKMAFLMLNCAETALPLGGDITIAFENGAWTLTGSGRRLIVEAELWEALNDPSVALAPPPGRVQFALLIQEVEARRAEVDAVISEEDQRISISVNPVG